MTTHHLAPHAIVSALIATATPHDLLSQALLAVIAVANAAAAIAIAYERIRSSRKPPSAIGTEPAKKRVPRQIKK